MKKNKQENEQFNGFASWSAPAKPAETETGNDWWSGGFNSNTDNDNKEGEKQDIHESNNDVQEEDDFDDFQGPDQDDGNVENNEEKVNPQQNQDQDIEEDSKSEHEQDIGSINIPKQESSGSDNDKNIEIDDNKGKDDSFDDFCEPDNEKIDKNDSPNEKTEEIKEIDNTEVHNENIPQDKNSIDEEESKQQVQIESSNNQPSSDEDDFIDANVESKNADQPKLEEFAKEETSAEASQCVVLDSGEQPIGSEIPQNHDSQAEVQKDIEIEEEKVETKQDEQNPDEDDKIEIKDDDVNKNEIQDQPIASNNEKEISITKEENEVKNEENKAIIQPDEVQLPTTDPKVETEAKSPQANNDEIVMKADDSSEEGDKQIELEEAKVEDQDTKGDTKEAQDEFKNHEDGSNQSATKVKVEDDDSFDDFADSNQLPKDDTEQKELNISKPVELKQDIKDTENKPQEQQDNENSFDDFEEPQKAKNQDEKVENEKQEDNLPNNIDNSKIPENSKIDEGDLANQNSDNVKPNESQQDNKGNEKEQKEDSDFDDFAEPQNNDDNKAPPEKQEDSDFDNFSEPQENDDNKQDSAKQQENDSDFDDFAEPQKSESITEVEKRNEDKEDSDNDDFIEPQNKEVEQNNSNNKQENDSDFDDFAEPQENENNAPPEKQEDSDFDDFAEPQQNENKGPPEKQEDSDFDDFAEPQNKKEDIQQSNNEDSDFDDFAEPQDSNNGSPQKQSKEQEDSDFDDFAEPEDSNKGSPQKQSKEQEDSDFDDFAKPENTQTTQIKQEEQKQSPSSPLKPSSPNKSKSVFTFNEQEYKSELLSKLSKISGSKISRYNLEPLSESINSSLSNSRISSHSYLKSHSTCQLFERRAAQNTQQQKNRHSIANFIQPYKFTVDTTYKSFKIIGKKTKNENKNNDQILDLDFDAAPNNETDFELQLCDVMKLNLDKVQWTNTWSHSRMNMFIKFDNVPTPKKGKKKQFINQEDIAERENDDVANEEFRMDKERDYISPERQQNEPFDSTEKNDNKVKQKEPDEPAPFFEGWDTDSFANQTKYESRKNSPEKSNDKPSALVSETFKEFGLDKI